MAESPSSATNEAQLLAAWDRFANDVKDMGRAAIASAPTDPDRVDALRFLLRQLAYREEQIIEFPPGTMPEFFWPESPTRKIFADCPDTIYRQFSVAPGATYRVRGTRGASPYISFTAYRAAVTERVVADLHDGEIEIADDGSFELTVGGPEQPTNWLDLGDDGAFVVIREYCHDRVNGEKASFAVDQLSPALTHRPEPDAAAMQRFLDVIALGLRFGNDASANLSSALRSRPNVMNEAAAELVSEMAGTPHNHYQLCYVQLSANEALALELSPPPCRYWSVHLNNWWLESPEYRDGQSVCINDAQAEREADGSVRILVGPDDPGGGNWLDTKGRTETILLARYLLPEAALPPIATTLIGL
ncbi:MAG: DUF1214 domain-containing protein [Actinomycetota bacterium]